MIKEEKKLNHFSDLIISVLSLSVVDSGLKPGWVLGQAKKYVCLRSNVKKNLGSVGIKFFYYGQNRKYSVPIPVFHFRISGKPSFVEAVLWRVTQFFYLLCSQFRQKTSGWINKTLLLIKQQKWLSEKHIFFCLVLPKTM